LITLQLLGIIRDADKISVSHVLQVMVESEKQSPQALADSDRRARLTNQNR
jgi:hypothetical protein